VSGSRALPPAVERVLNAPVDDTAQEEGRAIAEQAIADGDDPLLAVALDLARFKFIMRVFSDIPPQVDSAATKKRKVQDRHTEIRKLAAEMRAKNPKLSDLSIARMLSAEGHGSVENLRKVIAKK
jgi:hypothetical protein